MSTLKKISEVANCSLSTVSKALNNCNDISEKTREKILTIAKDMGYFQKKKKIKLENRKKNKFNIAILCPEIESNYYSKMIIDISYELSKYNSDTVIYNYSFDNNRLHELLDTCHNADDVDAIICLSKIVDYVLFDDMPVITFGENTYTTTFFYDVSAGLRAVFESLGKNDLIYIVSEDKTTSQEKEFSKISKDFTSITAKKFLSINRFEQAGYEAGEYFINNGILPNAVICAYDEIALGLIEYLSNQGIKIPEQVSVIGINDIPTAKYCFGGLTTISFDFKSIASVMIKDLIDDLKKQKKRICHYNVPSRLIKRNT